MFSKLNTDSLSKSMQKAGLKKSLEELKCLETSSFYTITPILRNIYSILTCYNCISCKCLKKRILRTIRSSNLSELIAYTNSLIAELDALLYQENSLDIPSSNTTELI